MGMKILKLKYHVSAFLRIAIFLFLFGSRFAVGGGVLPFEDSLTCTWKEEQP